MPTGVYERKPLQIARTNLTKSKLKLARIEVKLAEAIRQKTQYELLVKELETSQNNKH